jgi:hypothetical protein
MDIKKEDIKHRLCWNRHLHSSAAAMPFSVDLNQSGIGELQKEF